MKSKIAGAIRSLAIAAFAALAFHGPALADPAVEAANLELVEGRFEAWRTGDGSPFELLTADAKWVIEGDALAAGTYNGRDDFNRNVWEPLNARLSTALVPEVQKILALNDTVIVYFTAKAVTRDNQPYTNRYIWFLELERGRIVEAHVFLDREAFNGLWTRVAPSASAIR